MSWTSGFYNSVNGDRVYNAQQMSEIFEGLITNGVYESVGNKLAVQPNSGMTIHINSGRGWFASHWVNNDAEYLITLEDSDVLLNRYAAVCIRVDDSDSVRNAVPYVKYSAFASSPVKPTMTRNETVNEFCLAYVYIKGNATEITAAAIEDTRANTNLCGWVTGLIEQVDTTTLWEQWSAEWDEYMRIQKAEFVEWYNNLQSYLDENAEAKIAADLAELKANSPTKVTAALDGLGWDSQTDGSYLQTIAVSGVTKDSDVLVGATREYEDVYDAMGCVCVEQGTGTLTFKCTAPQDVAVTVSVIIFNL